MIPRHPSRLRRRNAMLMAVQRLRLEGIARGEYEPRSLREACFQGMILDGGRLPMRDFIVSPALFLLEDQEAGFDLVDTP
ncbi:hypothetical protein [Brevundimonas sp. GCM10030266]|uniref:hypothetical protein n=1 Tax=Brevundimonas sp. GCM10030266 TaxID=3273386 RepID=UPI003614F25F